MPFYGDLRQREGDSAEESGSKQRIADRLLKLRAGLREEVGTPGGGADAGGRFLRLATWNLREFDSPSYGPRLSEAIYFIAEIISHFDLVALQEVRQDLEALDRVKRALGPNWEYICTDVTGGDRGNKERLAFIFDTTKVFFRGVAGELTVAKGDRLLLPNSFDLSPAGGPQIELPEGEGLDDPGVLGFKTLRKGRKLNREAVINLPKGTRVTLPADAQLVFAGYPEELGADGKLDLETGRDRKFSEAVGVRIPTEHMRSEDLQFARTPFIVQFQSGWLKIALCTVHIYYGNDSEKSLKMARRKAEIGRLTKVLSDRAQKENDDDADSFFIALGDFNIVGAGHGTMAALESNDFEIPAAIQQIPAGTNVKRDKFYDQIAVWKGKTTRRQPFKNYTKVEVGRAGVFDFFKYVFRGGAQDPNKSDEAFYTALMQREFGRTWGYKNWRTYQMSDHLPMWIELRTDFADEYLEEARTTDRV
jgi:endonuclease/exonuclease/phosphatase family metal-dependent hydrolase